MIFKETWLSGAFFVEVDAARTIAASSAAPSARWKTLAEAEPEMRRRMSL